MKNLFGKKGQTAVMSTIITIILLFVLFLIIIMFAKTQSNINTSVATEETRNIFNESHSDTIISNFTIITLANNPDNATEGDFFRTVNVLRVTNYTTGEIIPTSNYTVYSSSGVIQVNNNTMDTINSSGGWNVTYNANYYKDEGAAKINIKSLTGLSDAAGDNASSIYLIVVIVLLLVFITLIVATVMKMRG